MISSYQNRYKINDFPKFVRLKLQELKVSNQTNLNPKNCVSFQEFKFPNADHVTITGTKAIAQNFPYIQTKKHLENQNSKEPRLLKTESI